VLAYDETEDWRGRQERTGAGLLEAVEELAAESGTTAEEERAGILEMNATYATQLRRFFLVAEAG
jgi:hypothetical protein